MYIASLLFTSSYLSPPFLLTALQAITRDPGTLFSTAVSIAPIVNWISSKRYVTYVLLRRTHPLPLSLRLALLSTTRGRFLCASLSFALLADADRGHTHTHDAHTHNTLPRYTRNAAQRYRPTLVSVRRRSILSSNVAKFVHRSPWRRSGCPGSRRQDSRASTRRISSVANIGNTQSRRSRCERPSDECLSSPSVARAGRFR